MYDLAAGRGVEKERQKPQTRYQSLLEVSIAYPARYLLDNQPVERYVIMQSVSQTGALVGQRPGKHLRLRICSSTSRIPGLQADPGDSLDHSEYGHHHHPRANRHPSPEQGTNQAPGTQGSMN